MLISDFRETVSVRNAISSDLTNFLLCFSRTVVIITNHIFGNVFASLYLILTSDFQTSTYKNVSLD